MQENFSVFPLWYLQCG